MHLPRVLHDIVMDYYEQLQWVEMHESMRQHLTSLNMMEELIFAHNNKITYELEFFGTPPVVLRNLDEIRGPYDPQDWDPGYLEMVANYDHPRVQAIMDRVTVECNGVADILASRFFQ